MADLPRQTRRYRGRTTAPDIAWIAPPGAPDDGPQWRRVDRFSGFRDHGPGPFPGTREVTMRHVPEPIVVRATDRSWYVLTCRQCTPHRNLPFPTPDERQTWLDEHHAETGHRELFGWEEGRG